MIPHVVVSQQASVMLQRWIPNVRCEMRAHMDIMSCAALNLLQMAITTNIQV